jgi:uncharacterized protein (TIGR00299 family) protein
MHIHLDVVGGIAGDMFAAAMLDAFPEHADDLMGTIRLLELDGVRCRHAAHRDHALTGSRFVVEQCGGHRHNGEGHHHHHRSFADIRAWLRNGPLPADTVERAVAIFAVLAEAEARVHGTDPETVEFHEVGNWDSIVDVVAAAFLIGRLGKATWSVSPLPMGGGRISTAHGVLPVPAPAVIRLLEGFALIDDGIGGERITPTGAAILKYLDPSPQGACGRLARSGTGFGTRRLADLPNVLRCFCFAEGATAGRPIGTLQFDVDDQTPEDLAVGLDHIRGQDGVYEVFQAPVMGKKGRMVSQITVLAELAAVERIAEACLKETTTLGVRWHVSQRRVLDRALYPVRVEGERLTAKVADRGDDGPTAKTDIDGVAHIRGAAARAARRRQGEAAGLERWFEGRHREGR